MVRSLWGGYMLTRQSRSASHTIALSCSTTPVLLKSTWETHEIVTPVVMSQMYTNRRALGFSSPKMKDSSSTTTGVDALIIWMKATDM